MKSTNLFTVRIKLAELNIFFGYLHYKLSHYNFAVLQFAVKIPSQLSTSFKNFFHNLFILNQ